MDTTRFIETVLNPFFSQVQKGSLKKSMIPKFWDLNIRIHVGFGAGRPSNTPFIAFLGPEQKSQKGIYPVLAYYKYHNLLFLAYGESVDDNSMVKWSSINKETIGEYVRRLHIYLKEPIETRYNHEHIYGVYPINQEGKLSEEDEKRLCTDLKNIIAEYKDYLANFF